MKLFEIAQGWWNFATASPEHKQMICERLKICDECPHKKQLSTAGKLLVTAINEKASIFYCGKCGCPLAAKTASPDSQCPLNKWKSFINEPSYY